MRMIWTPPPTIRLPPPSMSLNAAKTYGLIGAAFGLSFPILGTAFQCQWQAGHIDLATIRLVQATSPLLWIIDTAPLFLGLFAYFAGARQDRITAINHTLEERVAAQTENLRKANASLQREVQARIAREGELVEAYEEAQAGTRAKDKFISSVSHELRTPLSGILGMADELLESELTAEQRESLTVLSYSAANLLAIINDMLDLAKAAANKLELHPRDFAPAELLGSVHAAVRNQVATKRLSFEIRQPDTLPPMLHGDPVRLYQILLNLVGNAVKFTDSGGVIVEVHVPRCTATECALRITISDTGIGITPEYQQQIFEDFTQVHADTSARYGGTGLGLSITRQLVELHRGELTLESVPDQGTVFTVNLTLPVGTSVSPPVAESPPPPSVPTAPPFPSDPAADPAAEPAAILDPDLHVLLVEDHPVNQIVATAFLKRHGLRYDLAENGADAVRMAEATPYDLILMDIHLPMMDGLEATRRIRASASPHPHDTRIIALTASALQEEAQACLDAGMDAFIAKPFKPKDLYRTIAKVMRKPPECARHSVDVGPPETS